METLGGFFFHVSAALYIEECGGNASWDWVVYMMLVCDEANFQKFSKFLVKKLEKFEN